MMIPALDANYCIKSSSSLSPEILTLRGKSTPGDLTIKPPTRDSPLLKETEDCCCNDLGGTISDETKTENLAFAAI